MTEAQIDNKAFSFVELLIIIKEKNKKNVEKVKGSIDEVQVVDWSHKLVNNQPSVQKEYLPGISDYGISITIEKVSYGFREAEYINYYNLFMKLKILIL